MASLSLPRLDVKIFAAGLLPLAILIVVMLMVVPVPALVLDIAFVSNILLSLVMLMVVLNAGKPLDFSAFPTVLLFATLFRLALNVASTRVVLVAGHEGTNAAGYIIEAFGKAMIGSNFVVGLIVFFILMIINLAVIAKGAGRVSEVSARFILDALPGKQMAIDADLNAGMLTPDQARTRRQEVAMEADFYGSMDGASKFVKGDAIAGILILAINIIGGLLIGTVSHSMGLAEAADRYLLLSVGDALVAQVPALMLSIAAAILVTRSTDDNKLIRQLSHQFAASGAWWPAAAILFVLAMVPGMPGVILFPAASLAGFVAWRLGRPGKQERQEVAAAQDTDLMANDTNIEWSEVGEFAAINVEIGYGLIPLVDKAAPLMGRITAIRRQLSKELGFVLPLVRVRDDMSLAPQSYQITVAGELAGSGELWPADMLALEADDIVSELPGRSVTDPAFGLKARWIDPQLEEEAIASGYTVVDPSTVLGTHLHRLLRERAHLLFGQDEAHALIESLSQRQPQLAQSIGTKILPLPTVAAICQSLLEEGVVLRDFQRIASAIALVASRSQEPAELIELVRGQIGGLIVAGLAPGNAALKLIALSPALERLLEGAWRAAPQSAFPFEPDLSGRLTAAIADVAKEPLSAGEPLALISQPGPRRALWRLLRTGSAPIPVLAFTELPDSRTVDVVAVVGEGLTDDAPAEATVTGEN